MLVDLRSDTLTLPTKGMLEAMWSAKVGDDVWEEDPTVKELEKAFADEFGMAEGLYCPSGTMANQIAIRLHTEPQDEVICDSFSHIYNYEAAAPASNSLVSLKLLQTERGVMQWEEIKEKINPRDVHLPPSKLVVLENTCNKGGGYSYELNGINEISEGCNKNGIKLHMDGARVFNAIVSKGYSPKEIGAQLDSISICLSKGLGCPVGTVLLLKDPELLFKAKRVRKGLGGGMRQAGYLAAAGLFALKNNIERLAEDHSHAKALSDSLKETDWVSEVKEPETNIVLFKIAGDADQILEQLKQKGVLCAGMGEGWIRFVTHLGINSAQIDHALMAFKEIN